MACVVEEAVARTARKFWGHSDAWKVEHHDGRVKDWVCDFTCRLITVHHLPAAQVPGVVSEIMRAIRVNTDENDDIDPSEEETFSDPSLEVGGSD